MTKDDVLFGYRQQLFAEAARTNVSAACRTFRVHRSTYYSWKRQVDRPYTYPGEPTVRVETSPGRPGLVYLSAMPAPLARAAGRVALVVQAPNAPPAVDAERPRDQARHRGLVVASELRVQTGLVLDTLKRRVRAAVSHLQELAFRRTPQPSILNDPAMLEQQRTASRAQMTPAVM